MGKAIDMALIELEMWSYYRDHPSEPNTSKAPKELRVKLSEQAGAPLCQVYTSRCNECPLWVDDNQGHNCIHYYNWNEAKGSSQEDIYVRQAEADANVVLLEAWLKVVPI